MNDEIPEEFRDQIKERNLKSQKVKGDKLYNICLQQFFLSYSGHISISDSDEMSIDERNMFFSILQKQLKDEREAMERQQKEAAAKQAAARTSSRKR